MAQNPTAGTKRKPWWLFGILIILVSVASSATVYFLLAGDGSGEAHASVEEAEPVEAPPPIFATVEPFTVNLQGTDYEQRLLYIGLSFKVADEKTRELIEVNMPQVRSRLLMLLSSRTPQEIGSPEGKQALTADIRALFDQPFSDPQPELAINDVLYTDFIVQ